MQEKNAINKQIPVEYIIKEKNALTFGKTDKSKNYCKLTENNEKNDPKKRLVQRVNCQITLHNIDKPEKIKKIIQTINQT